MYILLMSAFAVDTVTGLRLCMCLV